MARDNPNPQSWKQAFALTVILFVLVIGLATIPVIRDSQMRLADTFFRLAPAPHDRSRVVLVLIDDQSLRQYGRWPWSRTLLAQLTRNLAQAGAGAIGLDILLSEPQSSGADKVLAQSFQENARTVIVDKIGSYADGPNWIEPLPEFSRSAAAVGHAQAVLDVDGVCRRFPARELTLDGARWAFAVELARRTDPQQTSAFLASYGIPLWDDASVSVAKPILVPIAFRRDRFETISAHAVLAGDDLANLQGKPVLLGFGPTEIGDRLSTPLTTEFPAPGVEIHAQILDSILSARKIYETPLWVATALLWFTCFSVVMIFRKWRGWAAVWLLVSMETGVYAGAFLTFLWFSHILPAGSMMLAVIAGPLLVYTADFVIIERSVTQQLLGLRSWLALQKKNGSLGEGTELSWKLQLLQNLQTQLGSRYELHKVLLESTQDLVAIFDEDGNLLLNNQPFAAACHLQKETGFTLEQLRSRLLPTEDGAQLSRDSSMEREAYLDEELYAIRLVPLPSTALAPGGGTIVTMTSLRTRVERDRARAEALGFITHELRTPLVSIQGFAELMMHYPSSPSFAGAPETIFRESKRLLALINSYLDVLRLDAGAKPVSSDLVDLDSIIDQVLDILWPLANAAKMRLQFESGQPAAIIGDAPLLSGAVLNLVSNAIKYGKAGTDVEVTCLYGEGEVVVRVCNVGDPIALEDIPRLFDAYYRASNVEGSNTGWGLGLAFVKRIAEKHGGSVRAESQPGGNCFEIHLPFRAGMAAVVKEAV